MVLTPQIDQIYRLARQLGGSLTRSDPELVLTRNLAERSFEFLLMPFDDANHFKWLAMIKLMPRRWSAQE